LIFLFEPNRKKNKEMRATNIKNLIILNNNSKVAAPDKPMTNDMVDDIADEKLSRSLRASTD
jgi:hypothetical protein